MTGPPPFDWSRLDVTVRPREPQSLAREIAAMRDKLHAVLSLLQGLPAEAAA